MFYGYLEQIERLKAKIEEKDTSRLHFLDLRKDGTFIDTDTKVVYRQQGVEREIALLQECCRGRSSCSCGYREYREVDWCDIEQRYSKVAPGLQVQPSY